MVPTLFGRIQTRLFLLAVIGGLVTLIVAPMLPMGGALGDEYQTTFVVLGTVAALGIGWELVYHFVMQWRWEKDWPTLFGLLTLLPEGLLVWALLTRHMIPGIPGSVPPAAFAIHFSLVWLAVWMAANGPMRVPFVRWRFHGGRLM
jgi:hypothetical protein